MNQRSARGLLAPLLVVVMVAFACTQPGPAANPSPGSVVELRMAGYLRTTAQGTQVEEPWINGIAQRSGGRVRIEHNYSDDLGLTGFDSLRVARQGIFDVVLTGAGLAAGDLPLIEGVDLAGLYKDRAQARQGLTAFTPVLRDAMSKKMNLNAIGLWALDRQITFCRFPVTSLKDLAGKKVRVPSTTLSDFMQAIGAQPVTIAPPEVYTSLERGVVDCAVTGPIGVTGSKLYEVTTHVYNLPLVWAVNLYAVNAKTWERLPADVRQFLEADFGKLITNLDQFFVDKEQDAINCIAALDACKGFTKAPRGLVIVNPTADDLARVPALMRDTVIPRWVSRCGADCVPAFNSTVGKVVGIEAK